jgi:hypothetical protein
MILCAGIYAVVIVATGRIPVLLPMHKKSRSDKTILNDLSKLISVMLTFILSFVSIINRCKIECSAIQI